MTAIEAPRLEDHEPNFPGGSPPDGFDGDKKYGRGEPEWVNSELTTFERLRRLAVKAVCFYPTEAPTYLSEHDKNSSKRNELNPDFDVLIR